MADNGDLTTVLCHKTSRKHRRLQSGTELLPGQGQSHPTLPVTPGGCEPACPMASIVAWSMVSIGFPSSSAFRPRGAPFFGEAVCSAGAIPGPINLGSKWRLASSGKSGGILTCDGRVEVDGPLGRVPGLVREVQPEEEREVGAGALVVLGVGGERVEGVRSHVDIREGRLRGLAVGAEARARAAGVGAGPVLLGLAPAPRLVVVWRVARAANTTAARQICQPRRGCLAHSTHW